MKLERARTHARTRANVIGCYARIEMVRERRLKGYLIRVGIDSYTSRGNIGYCAPVFHDNSFEYIPIPKFEDAPGEILTYGSLEAQNKQYGQFLSDFMHTDRHLFQDRCGILYISAVDENEQPLLAKDICSHFDPEFRTNTFGDARAMAGGRIPSDIDPGDYIFFYSGLARYDPAIYRGERPWHALNRFQIHNKCPFLIGYLKIRRIYDIRTEEDLSRNSSEIGNNAHFKERHIESCIIKGEDESKLLKKAVQLYYWDGKVRKYCPTETGEIIGLHPTRGVRIMKWLNRALCEELLRAVSNDS